MTKELNRDHIRKTLPLIRQVLDEAGLDRRDIDGVSYTTGPELARLAEQGDPGRFRFPRPMTDRPGLDFSRVIPRR